MVAGHPRSAEARRLIVDSVNHQATLAVKVSRRWLRLEVGPVETRKTVDGQGRTPGGVDFWCKLRGLRFEN